MTSTDLCIDTLCVAVNPEYRPFAAREQFPYRFISLQHLHIPNLESQQILTTRSERQPHLPQDLQHRLSQK